MVKGKLPISVYHFKCSKLFLKNGKSPPDLILGSVDDSVQLFGSPQDCKVRSLKSVSSEQDKAIVKLSLLGLSVSIDEVWRDLESAGLIDPVLKRALFQLFPDIRDLVKKITGSFRERKIVQLFEMRYRKFFTEKS